VEQYSVQAQIGSDPDQKESNQKGTHQAAAGAQACKALTRRESA
jgi:hypothetical protein